MKLIDANIFMYAAGSPHQHKAPSIRFLESINKGREKYCTNTEVIQEVFHRYRALDRFDVATTILETIIGLEIEILSVDYEDIIHCHALLRTLPSLSTRDAIHAAIFQRRKLKAVISFDKDFDEIPGLVREAPR